jgi:hypothetical protein
MYSARADETKEKSHATSQLLSPLSQNTKRGANTQHTRRATERESYVHAHTLRTVVPTTRPPQLRTRTHATHRCTDDTPAAATYTHTRYALLY